MKMEYIKTNKLPLLAQGVSGKASRIYNDWQCIEAVSRCSDKQKGSTINYERLYQKAP
jgi:hypothetical protein